MVFGILTYLHGSPNATVLAKTMQTFSLGACTQTPCVLLKLVCLRNNMEKKGIVCSRNVCMTENMGCVTVRLRIGVL